MSEAADDQPRRYLYVRVVEARNVPAADPNGLSDPYVKLKLNGGSKARSAVCSNTLDPVWNFDCTFSWRSESQKALREVEAQGVLSIEVYDHDHLSANDFLGQLKFNVRDLLAHQVVGGYFDLLDKNFAEKTRGDIYLIITHSEEALNEDHRTSLLNGLQAEMALKILKAKGGGAGGAGVGGARPRSGGATRSGAASRATSRGPSRNSSPVRGAGAAAASALSSSSSSGSTAGSADPKSRPGSGKSKSGAAVAHAQERPVRLGHPSKPGGELE